MSLITLLIQPSTSPGGPRLITFLQLKRNPDQGLHDLKLLMAYKIYSTNFEFLIICYFFKNILERKVEAKSFSPGWIELMWGKASII